MPVKIPGNTAKNLLEFPFNQFLHGKKQNYSSLSFFSLKIS